MSALTMHIAAAPSRRVGCRGMASCTRAAGCTRNAPASTTARHAVPRSGGFACRGALPRCVPALISPRSRAGSVVVAAAAVAAAPETPTTALAAVANAATNLFPLFVLGAAAMGVLQPTSFDWFLPSYIAPALGLTMLGMGMTLTFEVGPLRTATVLLEHKNRAARLLSCNNRARKPGIILALPFKAIIYHP